ncbi:MAG: uracil phosphoribosyltransferase [Nitriliruptorales bacterium]|nr:uracil phosphoribosyltransferase [Nitriliruptorales bacterium]
MVENVRVVRHPLAAHLLTELRDVGTEPERFRHLARRLSTVLVLEATRDLATTTEPVQTPLVQSQGRRLDRPVVAVPILRAGLGLLETVTDLLPDVRVGYAGLERDEETLQPTSYYLKVPELRDTSVLLLDPMLATGGSATFAVGLLKEHGATDIQLLCVVAAPEGIRRLTTDHADIRVVTAAVDDGLNDVGYIVPGLGDFGDRLFGTS